jgi:hypothetical protein
LIGVKPWYDVPMGLKLSVTTKVPARSTGRLVDALTDLVRPLTEKMGL